MSEIQRLVEVMRRLRAPDGCPWDRVQTHVSLKKNLIEEAAEFLDAIDEKDDAHMKEELGDLLMQAVLHAVIAEERNAFNFEDVAHDITEKMIRRHPHVFGDKKAESADDVQALWQKVKKEEKEEKNGQLPTSVLARIPHSLPGLMRAEKMQRKAAEVSFDWKEEQDVRAKLEEEFKEVCAAFQSGNDDAVDEELGDLMFTIVNLARFRKRATAEELLQRASDKFQRRFQYLESKVAETGKAPQDMTPEELDALWNEAKSVEKSI